MLDVRDPSSTLSARARETISTTKTQRHKSTTSKMASLLVLSVSVSSCLCGFTLLENKLHLPEQRKQRLDRIDDSAVCCAKLAEICRAVAGRIRIDVAKAAPWFQCCCSKSQRHIINQQWPIGDANAIVPADLVSNVRLEENVFQRLSAMEA